LSWLPRERAAWAWAALSPLLWAVPAIVAVWAVRPLGALGWMWLVANIGCLFTVAVVDVTAFGT
jgi:hypothetical protein